MQLDATKSKVKPFMKSSIKADKKQVKRIKISQNVTNSFI